MFKRILAPIDFAEGMEEFAKCLAGFKSLGAAEIIVVYCMELPNVADVRKQVQGIIGGEMERLCEIIRESGIKATAKVLTGNPATSITETAEQLDCSLVVTGARVHSLLGATIMGSAAHAAMSHPRRPVLTLRLHAKDETAQCENWPCRPMQTILFPTDFSDNAEKALTSLINLACRTKACVTLVHVQDRAKWGRHFEERLEEFNRIDRERMGNIAAKLQTAGIQKVKIQLETGQPAKAIINAGNQPDVSCILMSSRGRGFFGELTLGSVSHNVARHATAPVLLIP